MKVTITQNANVVEATIEGRLDTVTSAEFEKQLTLCLYENYPGLRFHIEKANEINENYYKDYPEFRIRFQPVRKLYCHRLLSGGVL